MEEVIHQLRIIRTNQINLISKFNNEQLNTIPDGFKNNLIWNFGHAIVTQHLLTYGLGKIPLPIENQIVENFRKGSLPNPNTETDIMDYLNEKAISSIDQLAKDLAQNKFNTFEVYQTSFGLKLENITQALMFNNVHEGLHFGYMLALKNCLNG